MNPDDEITVIKKDVHGDEVFRYSGTVLRLVEDHVLLEAFFTRGDSLFHGIHIRTGDRFVETFYFDRWYNIFEMYDGVDGQLKGWYCNIGFPAVLEDSTVSYRDLALDLLVYPDGRQLVLDEDEFNALSLDDDVQTKAREALAALQRYFQDVVKTG